MSRTQADANSQAQLSPAAGLKAAGLVGAAVQIAVLMIALPAGVVA